jgi:hypothetical protein
MAADVVGTGPAVCGDARTDGLDVSPGHDAVDETVAAPSVRSSSANPWRRRLRAWWSMPRNGSDVGCGPIAEKVGHAGSGPDDRRAVPARGFPAETARGGGEPASASYGESFFATLKAEIGTRIWPTREQARRDGFAYLAYYNENRLHSTVNYRALHEARVRYRPPIALAA